MGAGVVVAKPIRLPILASSRHDALTHRQGSLTMHGLQLKLEAPHSVDRLTYAEPMAK